MEKRTNFTQFEQKYTHISGCKIVHLCTIATVTWHICTVTVAYAFNILLVFFLSLLSLLWFSLSPDSILVSALTSPPSPFSSFALTLTIAAGQTMPPLPLVKPCLHCSRFWASSPFRQFSLSTSRFWDSSRTHWSDMTMWWSSASPINLRSHNKGGSTFEIHWSDEAMTRRWTSWWTSASSKLKS